MTVEWAKRDKYGRVVRKILDGERDVNLALVGTGWWYRKYPSEQSPVDRKLYEAAGTKARAARLGLWTDPNPVPPSEIRHGAKMPPRPASAPNACPCATGAELCTGT